MIWRIEQQGQGCWRISRGDEHHWATSAADAVALLVALQAAGV